jgi:hypothetical protein
MVGGGGAVRARTSVLFGLYSNFKDLRSYADGLRQIGFQTNDISVLFPERSLYQKEPFLKAAEYSMDENVSPSEPLFSGPLAWLSCVAPPPSGELASALEQLGIPRYAAERYEAWIRNGQILTAVRSSHPSVTECVCEILSRTGAVGILVTGHPKATTLSQLRVEDEPHLQFEIRSPIPEETAAIHSSVRAR